MSEEKVEGANAKADRENREAISKLLGNISPNHTLIVITKDMTGQTHGYVHIQGPFKDEELYYGMLERAKRVVATSFTQNILKDN